MRLPLLAALLAAPACSSPPTDAELADFVRRGDLPGLERALAEVDVSQRVALQPWAALLASRQALAPDRAAVRAAEREMLAAAAEEALAEGRIGAAAAPLAAGLRAYPDDPRFPALQQRLRRAAETAPPDQAASAWGAVAATVEADPVALREALRRHRQAGLFARYTAEQRPSTADAQRGITLSAARHLLQKIDAEYYVKPDWGRALAEATAHVEALRRAPGALEAWPALSDLRCADPPTTADLRTASSHLAACVVAAQDAGVSAEAIIHTWVEGALAGLDPWTRAVWPAEMAQWEQHHAGVTHGVGVVLEQTPAGGVRVVRPIPGSPAWDGGLHQDDVLLRIEDERFVANLPDIDPELRLGVSEEVLRGEPGTQVAVRVARERETLDFTLTRAPVAMQTVSGFSRAPDNAWSPWLREDDGLAYVQISTFRAATEADFDAMLEPASGALRGLVLDLRGNPGGDVNAAVQIGDRFVEEGVLAELSGRVEPETGPDVDPETGQRLIPWNQAVPGHALEGVPTVVLVDADTASAAEILAGLLQERAGALVVGAPTWGKGLAQALRAEPERGYGVQFTNQVWTLPSGRQLSREVSGGGGIQPDLSEQLSPAEAFQARLLAQKRTALRVHADGSPMRWSDTRRRDDMPPLDDDPALLLAELALRALLVPSDG